MKSVSRYLLSAVALLFVFDSFGQQIRFADDRVIVDQLDKEVLYYFARYRNKPEVWREVFPVKVSGASMNIAGEYKLADSSVTFTPDFPFARGVDYEAKFFADQLAGNPNEVHLPYMDPAVLSLKFRINETRSMAPQVTTIYPTSGKLPENLLRFHIEFSTPMTRGDLYKRVHIIDEQQKEVEKALLVVDEELWNDEMTSVTVILDPGRIKRGLRANVEMNAPLIAGRKYTLLIDAGWKNSDGVAMKENVRKTFSCYEADRVKPDVSVWTIIPPSSPNGALVIRMNESYDIVLARNSILVRDVLGNNVNGKLLLSDNESTLTFVPALPWSNEKYMLLVNPKLEDLAGNNYSRLFDTDLQTEIKKGEQAPTLSFSPVFLH